MVDLEASMAPVIATLDAATTRPGYKAVHLRREGIQHIVTSLVVHSPARPDEFLAERLNNPPGSRPARLAYEPSATAGGSKWRGSCPDYFPSSSRLYTNAAQDARSKRMLSFRVEDRVNRTLQRAVKNCEDELLVRKAEAELAVQEALNRKPTAEEISERQMASLNAPEQQQLDNGEGDDSRSGAEVVRVADDFVEYLIATVIEEIAPPPIDSSLVEHDPEQEPQPGREVAIFPTELSE